MEYVYKQAHSELSIFSYYFLDKTLQETPFFVQINHFFDKFVFLTYTNFEQIQNYRSD
jgi:hypothetical protein